MMYDLIEVTPKINKKKVIITILLLIIVITASVGLGIYCAKKTGVFSEMKNAIEDNSIATLNISDLNNKTKHIAKVNFNPNYTDIRKELNGEYLSVRRKSSISNI